MSIKRPFEGPFEGPKVIENIFSPPKFFSPGRTTYQDHWFDNFGNAIVGHFFAQVNPLKSLHISEDLLKTFTQVLIPLDHDMFWLSRVLRICESLEKHSGVTFKN